MTMSPSPTIDIPSLDNNKGFDELMQAICEGPRSLVFDINKEIKVTSIEPSHACVCVWMGVNGTEDVIFHE